MTSSSFPCSAAGSFYNVTTKVCLKCPSGTFWPHTGIGKGTEFLETTECLPCPGSAKVGATTCPGWSSAYAKNKTTKSWKA